MTKAWISKQGDTFVVMTSDRGVIYRASPTPGMLPPEERAKMYLRALLATASA